MDVLNKAFSTPMDREELYRAISSIDHIINYAKTTVREMEVLGVAPDAVTQEFAERLLEGALAVQQGYRLLETDPAAAEASAAAARKAERNCEKNRHTWPSCSTSRRTSARLEASGGPTGGKALAQVMEVMKKREVYPAPVQRRRPHGPRRPGAARHRRQDGLTHRPQPPNHPTNPLMLRSRLLILRS